MALSRCLYFQLLLLYSVCFCDDVVKNVKHNIGWEEGVWAPKNQMMMGNIFGNIIKENVLLTIYKSCSIANFSDSMCRTNLMQVFDNVLNPQSLQMLDAIGKPPSGILKGNSIWPGTFKQCKAIKNMTYDYENYFDGRYCLSTINLVYDFKVGLCVPSSCNGTELQEILSIGAECLKEKIKIKIPVTPKKTLCDVKMTYSTGFILTMVIISIFLLLCLLSTLYEIILIRRKNSPELINPYLAIPADGVAADGISNVSENEEVAIKDRININISWKSENETHTSLMKLLLSFSIISNGRKILAVENSEKNLQALHGIRVLSMWWVILGHSTSMFTLFSANLADANDIIKDFFYQAIVNATFSVDSFFVLSGLLVTYLTLRVLKEKEKVNWVLFYIHRYWRLTPMYGLVILFLNNIVEHVVKGPFILSMIDMGVMEKDACNNYWWTNLLYINNFYPYYQKDTCMAWGWYLANDMQFFIISPLLIYLLYKKKWVGVGVICTLILSCIVTNAGIAYSYSLPAAFSVNPKINGTDPNYDYNYSKPYTRISTYLVGMLIGALLVFSNRKIKISKIFVYLGWMAAISLNLAVVYGLYKDQETTMSRSLSTSYLSMSRFCWSLGLAWVIIACLCGYGGPVNIFLSWNFWIPLSRLTYCAYLLHPLTLYIYALNNQITVYYDGYLEAYLFIAHVVVAYGAAFLTSLVFEAPLIALDRIILKRE